MLPTAPTTTAKEAGNLVEAKPQTQLEDLAQRPVRHRSDTDEMTMTTMETMPSQQREVTCPAHVVANRMEGREDTPGLRSASQVHGTARDGAPTGSPGGE